MGDKRVLGVADQANLKGVLIPTSGQEFDRLIADMWILQLHKDVPKAARFYSEGLDFTVNYHSDHIMQKGYSSLLSFTVTDINSTVTRLMALGAELDGSIKYEIHGKVAAMRCMDGHMLGLYEPA
ncbi:hypothetical protein FEM48_Zijuj11G0021300 [Ziziphus jujuba var. spinosa]|uniref:Lactoylglutathione lyase-like n=1 Tax=Ziziphus jujuba var. spinosa TaxID=714518 RepID=A0A978UG75_ZIZJJ|nr:hypothetical protein FEM48_Zijuj11G0021300 [Ziziphus jujuba var. spinosa]